MRHVHAFAHHAPGLRDQLGVDHRQKRRVIPDVVFHHQHDGHAHIARVMRYVALVFDVLDDRNQNPDVALPQKDSIDVADRIARDEVFYLAIVIGENHHWNVETRFLYLVGQLGGIHVANFQIRDDQVEAWLVAGQSFFPRRNLSDGRNTLQVKFK